MVTTKYGVLADYQGDPSRLNALVRAMENEGVDAYIWNGIEAESPELIFRALQEVAQTGKPVFAQPGSHEPMAWWEPVMQIAQQHYSNVTDATKKPWHDGEGHRLVFMPGSDVQAGAGQYHLAAGMIPGDYLRTQEGMQRLTPEEFSRALQHPQLSQQLIHVHPMESLEQLVRDEEGKVTPQNTILVSHVPPRFSGKKGVDYAFFGQDLEQQGIVPGEFLEGFVRTLVGDAALSVVTYQVWKIGYKLKHDNVGNKTLSSTMRRSGVTKAITSHIHEAGHYAHDMDGNFVAPETPSMQLAHNTGSVGEGKAAIYTIDSDNNNAVMSYKNIMI